MDEKTSLRLTEAIEQLNPEVTVKLIQAIEKLIQELKEKSPFDALSERKKSFIEASKAFTLFAGAGLNAMNAFAITLAYMSKHAMNVNEDAANITPTAAPPTDSATSPPNTIQSFLILGTMFCFLFTSCAAAVAHATVHHTKWLSMLVVIMILEVILVNGTCAFYCYLLTEGVSGLLLLLYQLSLWFSCLCLLLSASMVEPGLLEDKPGWNDILSSSVGRKEGRNAIGSQIF